VDDPGLVVSGFSLNPADTGDNSAALLMADLRNASIMAGDTMTLNEFYEATVTELAVEVRANERTLETQTLFVGNLQQQRQEVSGVSIDEEVTNLILFQRAFEASARVMSVADSMLQTLLGIVG